MNSATRGRPPRTLTQAEQKRLLRVTREHARSYRDHMLIAMALGTGLREHELVALDMFDVYNTRRSPRRRIALRVFKGCEAGPPGALQEVFVPDVLGHKLKRFRRWKRDQGESLHETAPLFIARGGNRLSVRRVRESFAQWREASELNEQLTFHALRHTFCQRLYEKTRDLALVKRAARHASIQTTTIYAAPSTDDLERAIRDM